MEPEKEFEELYKEAQLRKLDAIKNGDDLPWSHNDDDE